MISAQSHEAVAKTRNDWNRNGNEQQQKQNRICFPVFNI